MKDISLFFLIFIHVFFIYSCKNEKYEKQIIGTWICIGDSLLDSDKEIKYSESSLCFLKGEGITFYSNDKCEFKPGYFKGSRGKREYIAGTTKYMIENDSLKVFNLSSQSWEKAKIIKVKNDTILCQSSNNHTFILRKIEDKRKIQPFDKIIVSKSACFGTCPINDIMISKDGSIYYNGEEYNTINGFFKYQVKDSVFFEIESRFSELNIDTLRSEYWASISDQQTISVTFIRDNKIYKTISDYGKEAPALFYWAYTPVSFLYQKYNGERVLDRQYLDIDYFIFKQGEKELVLSKSESFYLRCLLQEAKEYNEKNTIIGELYPSVQKAMKETYYIKYCKDDQISDILSNGRFFRFKRKDGRVITLDIGYDFIQQNNFAGKFDYPPN